MALKTTLYREVNQLHQIPHEYHRSLSNNLFFSEALCALAHLKGVAFLECCSQLRKSKRMIKVLVQSR